MSTNKIGQLFSLMALDGCSEKSCFSNGVACRDCTRIVSRNLEERARANETGRGSWQEQPRKTDRSDNDKLRTTDDYNGGGRRGRKTSMDWMGLMKGGSLGRVSEMDAGLAIIAAVACGASRKESSAASHKALPKAGAHGPRKSRALAIRGSYRLIAAGRPALTRCRP